MPHRLKKKWEFNCSATKFASLRTDKAFHQLLALARLINAMRFSQSAIPKRPKSTPAGSRQLMNVFFNLSALVFEGWQLVNRMAQHYRTTPGWQHGFKRLLGNASYKRLVDQSLKPLRNQAAFHFFEDEIAVRIVEHVVDTPEVTFVSGRGQRSRDCYYDLADILAMRTFIGTARSDAELLVRANELFVQTSELTVAFLTAGDILIVDSLGRLGFHDTSASRVGV